MAVRGIPRTAAAVGNGVLAIEYTERCGTGDARGGRRSGYAQGGYISSVFSPER